MDHQPNEALEMYLRVVLELEEERIPTLRARVAERLGLTPPAVSEGVARMERFGYVRLARDRRIVLTVDGRAQAEHVLRKHRLAERFLADVLGLDHEHLHVEACRWEHAMSDRIEQRLSEYLGHPTTSPFGNPMPGSAVEGNGVVCLLDTDAEVVTIRFLSEQLQSDREVVRSFEAVGARPGCEVAVRHHPYGVSLEHDAAVIELSSDQAELVFVTVD